MATYEEQLKDPLAQTGSTLDQTSTALSTSGVTGDDPRLSGINSSLEGIKSTLTSLQSPTVNSETLAPTPDLASSLTQPELTPAPSVTGLNSEIEMTAPEKEASSLTQSLRGLIDQSVGESAYRTEQENAQGLPGLQQTQSQLSSQLKALQNEAQAIPLQLQQESTGRGITTGGLAPIQAGRLRTNAIAALGVSTLLEASRGNITLAQNLVDRAVKAKYDPIEEKIRATQANLQLVLNSPEYSIADKNRAMKQQAIQDKLKAETATKKENMGYIQSWAAAALANGATPYQAQQIMTLANSDNPDLNKAFALYSPFARDPNAVQESLLKLDALRNKNEMDRLNIALAKETNPLEIKKLKAEIAKINADAVKSQRATPINPTGEFKSDLDALIANVPNLISSLNGKEAFYASIKGARNEADKINAIATVVLRNSPAEIRGDFTKQAQAVGSLGKAISLIDSQAKTGVLQAAKQYTFNLAGKDYDPKLAAIQAYITAAIQPYRSSITGAAWGDQEEAEYQQLFGSIKYSPTELKERLQRLQQIMADKSAQALNSQINPMNYYENQFNQPSSTGQVIEYQGKRYSVDAQGNMTPL